jgi:small subunit ribosomal protein S9
MSEVKDVINTIGRRKTSVARIYLKPGKGEIIVNNKPLVAYFPTGVLQTIVTQPLAALDMKEKYDIKVNVKGGGVSGQAEAVRLAIARALTYKGKALVVNGERQFPNADKYLHLVDTLNNHVVLKKEGFLTRDSRMVERKKYGKRKARRRFQFSKR